MSRKIELFDCVVNNCDYFYNAYYESDISVNNGYNCSHLNQEEFEEVNGVKIGKCYCWSCPMAYEADEEDFKNVDINKNGWNIDDYEEMTFLVIEE